MDTDLADKVLRQKEEPRFECIYRDVLGGEYRTLTGAATFHMEGLNHQARFTLSAGHAV